MLNIFCQLTNILDIMNNKEDKLSKKIGIKIKLERTKRGLSQEQLAELADISRNYMGAIERGTSSPTIDMLNQIAQALEIELVELINVSKVDL